MNRLKELIRNFFTFSRSETNAFLILLPLLVLIIFSVPIYRYWFKPEPQKSSQDSVRLDSLVKALKWEKADSSKSDSEKRLFSFDPNTATQENFLELGFSKSIAGRIINYRAKGGKFYVKSDLLKIYGSDTAFYRTIYSYINLPEVKKPTKPLASKAGETKRSKEVVKILDLNMADTAQLIKVYGIGKKLSESIVKYRDRLGGFISMDQLKEVYGLDEETIDNVGKKFYIKATFQPKLISLNSATLKDLSSHPYLSYKLANAIVAYRFQHGNFNSMDDIGNVKLMTESDVKKIKPYLTLNP